MNTNNVNKKSNPDMFDPTEGLGELLSMPTKIKTNSGEELEIPVASWRMELQVVKSVAKLFKQVRAELNLTWSDFTALQQKPVPPELLEGDERDEAIMREAERKEKLVDLVVKIAEIAPDEITQIVAMIIGKEPDFVEANLELSTILKVVLPFLMQRMSKLVESMSPMGSDFANVTQKIQASLTAEPESTKSPR